MTENTELDLAELTILRNLVEEKQKAVGMNSAYQAISRKLYQQARALRQNLIKSNTTI